MKLHAWITYELCLCFKDSDAQPSNCADDTQVPLGSKSNEQQQPSQQSLPRLGGHKLLKAMHE